MIRQNSAEKSSLLRIPRRILDSPTSFLVEHRKLIKKLFKLHKLTLESDEDELKKPIYCRVKKHVREYLTDAVLELFNLETSVRRSQK